MHPLAWIAAYKIARKYQSRFCVEVRDLWPEMWLLGGQKEKMDPMVIFWCIGKVGISKSGSYLSTPWIMAISISVRMD